jgi:hypothetical protein
VIQVEVGALVEAVVDWFRGWRSKVGMDIGEALHVTISLRSCCGYVYHLFSQSQKRHFAWLEGHYCGYEFPDQEKCGRYNYGERNLTADKGRTIRTGRTGRTGQKRTVGDSRGRADARGNIRGARRSIIRPVSSVLIAACSVHCALEHGG